MTIDDCIKTVLELDQKATKRPWEINGYESRSICNKDGERIATFDGGYFDGASPQERDCELSAYYRTSAPLLAKACEMMKAYIKYQKEIECSPMCSCKEDAAKVMADIEKMFAEGK